MPVYLPTSDKHVDDMTPTERDDFRAQQVAALSVSYQHGEVYDVADAIAGFCDQSTKEMLFVAVSHLALLMEQVTP